MHSPITLKGRERFLIGRYGLAYCPSRIERFSSLHEGVIERALSLIKLLSLRTRYIREGEECPDEERRQVPPNPSDSAGELLGDGTERSLIRRASQNIRLPQARLNIFEIVSYSSVGTEASLIPLKEAPCFLIPSPPISLNCAPHKLLSTRLGARTPRLCAG